MPDAPSGGSPSRRRRSDREQRPRDEAHHLGQAGVAVHQTRLVVTVTDQVDERARVGELSDEDLVPRARPADQHLVHIVVEDELASSATDLFERGLPVADIGLGTGETGSSELVA